MKTLLPPLLENPKPLDLFPRLTRHACVAVILKGNTLENLQLGFIQRAFNPEDRWSGHIAFPGGKKEESDTTDLEAALRETREEIGVELKAEELIGRLDDIQARKGGTMLDFYIRPFVFHLDREITVTPDPAEVADFFWVPVRELINPTRQTVYEVPRENGSLKLPAVSLGRELPLWGLTYMMVLNLLERLHGVIK